MYVVRKIKGQFAIELQDSPTFESFEAAHEWARRQLGSGSIALRSGESLSPRRVGSWALKAS
jgi:hypothetical protein